MKILILQHLYNNFATSDPLVKKLCHYWSNQGHEIVIASGVNQTLPDADIAILHVDLTKLAEEYSHALDKFPVIINGHIQDISKDLYSDLIVSKDDNYQGEVIVKTKANVGGILEQRIKNIETGKQPGRPRHISWSEVEYMPVYKTFKSITHVPDGVWKNNHLIVEKFLPEQTEDGLYQIRLWLFF